MANRLKGLEVEEVSLVDVPAIRRKFLITKRDGAAATGDTKTEPVQKAASFNQLINARNLDDNMWDAFYALKESIYQALGETNATELINKNIAEFTTYLTGVLANQAAVTKAKNSFKPEDAEPVVKAGAKISRARMEKLSALLNALKEGATSLEELLKEVSPEDDDEGDKDKDKNQNEPDPNKDKGDGVTKGDNPSAGDPAPDNGVAELAKSVSQLTELVQGLVTPDKLAKMVEEQLKTV